ncbi:hypothetical protein ACVWZR_007096 [Bradyrhizobium sp. i1.3.1]
MIAAAALAVRIDNEAGGIDRPLITTAGSGVSSTAPMAVK